MSKLKVGIIGCGGIAKSKHFPALASQSEKAEMVAFCDIIEERAVKAAEKYGVVGAKTYTEYRELLNDKSIDVVHICTPNRSHSEITVAALEAGKHVMCEKPMAINSVEAQKMLDAAKRTGKKLTIGYQNRFRPDTSLLKKIIDDGKLGDIYYTQAHAIRRRAVPTWGVFMIEYEQGGGPLIDIGTHALDLALYMMNNYEPESVIGQTFKKLSAQDVDTGNVFGDWKKEEFTVEDSAFGFIKMKNGAVINLESSWALNIENSREASITLCGTLAGADLIEGNVRLNKVEFGKQCVEELAVSGKGVPFYNPSNQPSDTVIECSQWLDAIIEDKQPVVLPEQAIVVTKILDAIYKSAKENTAIFF